MDSEETTLGPMQPTSRMCFVCGRENPVGLHLHFHEDREKKQLIAPINLPAHYAGYPGIAHGGVVATILDEVSGRAINIGKDEERFWVTAKLEIRYRQPTPVETPLTAVGWVVKDRGRIVEVAAEMRLPDGTVTAEAHGVVVQPPDETMAKWVEEKQFWQAD